MLFNSFEFLLFFPLVTSLYFILPHQYRWFHLLCFSCVFYCFFIPVYLSVLAVTIIVDYVAALCIEKTKGLVRKLWLIGSIVSTCLILFVFKYFNFFVTSFTEMAAFLGLNYPIRALSIILPIGLSFHTFQSLSYVIEVYRGKQKAEHHFGIYALYVMFYPQLIAGPIERPQHMLHQFYEKHNFNYEDAVIGLKRMLWGMFKKVVIADRLSIYVNSVYNNQEHHNGSSLIIATIFFAFQIYCDFSGYSDIAIGAARVMGFKLSANFNRPYFSRSISMFWKRWHVSLSTWFRDYVYIPLGGNRGPVLRIYFNLLFTFTLSGLWHGANWTYVIWGALNGVYLIVAKLSTGRFDFFKSRLMNSGFKWMLNLYDLLITFCLILFSWIFFRAANLTEAFAIIAKIFEKQGSFFIGDQRTFVYGAFFLLILLVVESFEEFKIGGSFSLFNHKNIWLRRTSYLVVVLLILLFGVFDNNQFIYFQF